MSRCSTLSCHDTILRVRSGPCRGVVVLVPADQATIGAFVKVAGWGRHVVRQDTDGETFLMNVEPKEHNNV